MRSRIPDMNDKQLEKMAFLERCLHCLHVVGERIEVRGATLYRRQILQIYCGKS